MFSNFAANQKIGFFKVVRSHKTTPFFNEFDESIRKSVMENPHDYIVDGFVHPAVFESTPYSKKIFLGGLPREITEEELLNYFSEYGALSVDWPNKGRSIIPYPSRGFAYLHFESDDAPLKLLQNCTIIGNGKRYVNLPYNAGWSSHWVEIRYWLLRDANYLATDNTKLLNPEYTAFVGGTPRNVVTAKHLHGIFETIFGKGKILYVAVEVDDELYPKGSSRVTFADKETYECALDKRFIKSEESKLSTEIEIKPYILTKQTCCVCYGRLGDFARIYCGPCRKYFDYPCAAQFHNNGNILTHKPTFIVF